MVAVNRIVEKSQAERNKSCQLRTDADALVNKVAQEMWDAWSNTNNALAFRSSELLEAKNRLQQHLQKVKRSRCVLRNSENDFHLPQVHQEIFDVEKNLELMRKAIADKSYVMRVAHTRLEARMHRPDLELCRDYAHVRFVSNLTLIKRSTDARSSSFYVHSLQKEVDEINHQVERMHRALKELENQHQKLLRTRTALEHDLALKIDAMYIDREKVSGLRRAYPINALVRF